VMMFGRLPFRRLAPVVTALSVLVPLLAFGGAAQAATKIERVVSRGGIEAWLVHESAVPVVAIEFAFVGGANEDPAEKPGVANMVASLLDEGAGPYDSRAFQEQLEQDAVELRFRAARDEFRGSLRTLSAKRDKAVELLRLAVNAPRFDAEPVERIRAQILAGLKRETTDPDDIARRSWWRTAFPGHPYGRPERGTLETVPQINVADLKAYTGRVLARDNLKIAAVGDIDAKTLGEILDRVFGELPQKAKLSDVPAAKPQGLGRRVVVDLDVPQAVMMLGGEGIARKDPDFIPAYIVNHILGGGSFSSRLYHEVREQRGLAYSVYSVLIPLDHAALFLSGTATRAERAGDALGIIESAIRKMAESGPTAEELAMAKSYLKGSYPLQFDTSTKIAGQLLQIQLDDLGIDYIERRKALIDAVTLDDVKRVAKRLLDGGLLVTVVGKPKGITPSAEPG